ncbi:MAG: tetratricopeptide repeat protein [Verrucomicrobiales bacterium]|jgi:TolA-binding protein|nr:tetratricopeptide repeat protein [Verrucomicrobiales bacterium]
MHSRLTRLVSGAWVCACLWLFTVIVSAQETPATSYGMAQAGYKAYQEGKYQDAAALLEQLLQKFPTADEAPNARYLLGLSYYSLGKYADGVKMLSAIKGIDPKAATKDADIDIKFIPIARFHLGVCLYLTGEYDKAYLLFDAVAKSDSQELQPYAYFYYARAKLDQAGKQPADAKRAAADGAAKLDELMQKFPDSDIIPDAIMTKANLFIAARDFTQAAQVLNELKARPESKELELDIDYLLGYTYTQQAKALREEFKNDEAAEAIGQAREVYTRLAANDNLVVANNAAFQLADLEFDAAMVAPPEAREAAFQKAIDAYRSLKSKDSLLEAQTKIVQGIRDSIGKAAGDPKRVTALTRQRQREEQKLAGLQSSADQATSGLMRVGDCYQRMGKYDEARIVYRAALPTANEEQATTINTQIIITYAMQGQSQKAEDAYAKFKQEHANDPNAAVVPYFIGIALTQEKKYAEAVEKFDQVVKDYPTSKVVASVPQAKATAYLAWGKVDEALKSYDDFITAQTGKIDPEAIDSAKLLRGYALATAKKYPAAIAAFQDVAASAKNPAVRAEAALCAGDYLNSTGKYDLAIETFQNFIKNFPDSPKLATAAYSIGWAYEGKKAYADAVKAYQAAIENYPDDQATQLRCYDRIWRCYLVQNEYDQMVQAQEAQVAAFPGNDRNMSAYFERGKYLEEKKQPLSLPDIDAAYRQVAAAFNAMPDGMKVGDAGKRFMQYPSSALLRLAGLYQREALKLGNFDTLDADQLATWKEYVNNAYQAVDLALQKYHQTNLGLELQNMNKIQLLRIKAKLATPEDATTYLSTLAGTFSDKASSIQILIARAAFVYEMDNKVQALNFYKEAFGKVAKPTDITWQDYDRYGSILLDNKNWPEAKDVFETLQKTYEKPPHAQAAAVYGLGAAETGLGHHDQAREHFSELKTKYPWSEKLLNADYQSGLAEAGKGTKEGYDAAFKIWKTILAYNSSNLSNANEVNKVKAQTMISFAQTLVEMGDKKLATDEIKTKDNPYEVAAQYGLKAYFFYPEQPSSPEGLYIAVSIYSQQLNKKADATKWFNTLSQKYPTSPWTSKAQSVLK